MDFRRNGSEHTGPNPQSTAERWWDGDQVGRLQSNSLGHWASATAVFVLNVLRL
jgi:hypothetical protein